MCGAICMCMLGDCEAVFVISDKYRKRKAEGRKVIIYLIVFLTSVLYYYIKYLFLSLIMCYSPVMPCNKVIFMLA